VVGHNIANVNTPGYTRQRANLTSNQGQSEGQVYFGTGVSLTSVQGVRDKFLDLQIYQETARQTGANERLSGLTAVSTTLGDTGTSGLAAQIQNFFQGFQDLASQPESGALRTNLLGQAQTMITGMQAQYRVLTDQRNSDDQAVASLVTEVNALTDQIAQLNQRISTAVPKGSDSDAVDQRKTVTDSLAALVGINVSEGNNGDYQITLDSGSAVLVSGNSSFKLQTTTSAALDNHLAVQSVMGASVVDVTGSIKNGQLGGKLDLRDNILAGYQRQLDQIAAGVAEQVNTQHKNGFDLSGNAGVDFFKNGTANYAVSDLPLGQIAGLPTSISSLNNYKGMVNALSVNAAIVTQPSLIAAAGATGAPGDNTNANVIAKLQQATATVDTNGDGSGDSGPYSTSVGSLVSDVGTAVQKWGAQNTTQQNLVTALQAQRDSVSGVSLDEEATNMMTLQRGYQASARFISVINQLTDELVNNFGK
jgi:flagellar hook-associated protein 1 FlgK